MKEILESAGAFCIVVVSIELISRVCSEDGTLRFVRSLVITVLLASVLRGFFFADWKLDWGEKEEGETGLSQYIWEEYGTAAEDSTVEFLSGLLESAGVRAEKIQVFTDIEEESGIVLTKVTANFAYDSDARRGLSVLQGALGHEVEVEVQTDEA